MWTPHTLADLWCCEVSVIVMLLEKGVLQGTYVNGEWQITHEHVHEYLTRKRGTPWPTPR